MLLLPILGYFVATALLIGSVALFERAQRPWVVVITALGGAVLYWSVFVKLLGVNLPVGGSGGGFVMTTLWDIVHLLVSNAAGLRSLSSA